MSTGQLIRFALFFSFLAFLICGTVYFLLKRRLGFSKLQNRVLLVALVSVAVLMIAGPVIYRKGEANIDNIWQQGFQFTQYFLMGWVAMLFMVLVSLEVLNSVVRLLTIPFNPEKRTFFTESAGRGFAVGTSAMAVGGLFQAIQKPETQRVTVRLRSLPVEFENYTIAQISDVHIGPLLHHDFLHTVVSEIATLRPDLIAITGDLVDGTVDQLRKQIEPLRSLQAKDGVFFCTGNHEYYSGAEEWIAHLESMGIHTFRNSNKIIQRGENKILIGGVYDWQSNRYLNSHSHDPFAAIQTQEANADSLCKILLAHNPFSIDSAAAAGWNLQLSGHTHAGQFYPFVYIVKMALKHNEGLYQISEQTQLYVNRGTGFWGPPNRLGKPSEITLLTLKRA